MIHDSQNRLRNDAPLFLAIGAWIVTASSLAYVFANLGELEAILFKEHMDHSLISTTLAVVGVLAMFCLCCGLAKAVSKSGYKQFSKKGF